MPEITHDPLKSHFIIEIDGAPAKLEYSRGEGLMTITHTFVPPELRGKNIAGQLAKAAFDFARAEGLKVVPQCSYIAIYAKRHPEAAELL